MTSEQGMNGVQKKGSNSLISGKATPQNQAVPVSFEFPYRSWFCRNRHALQKIFVTLKSSDDGNSGKYAWNPRRYRQRTNKESLKTRLRGSETLCREDAAGNGVGRTRSRIDVRWRSMSHSGGSGVEDARGRSAGDGCGPRVRRGKKARVPIKTDAKRQTAREHWGGQKWLITGFY